MCRALGLGSGLGLGPSPKTQLQAKSVFRFQFRFRSPETRPKIPLYIILLTYVNQAYEHAPHREAEEAGARINPSRNVWMMLLLLRMMMMLLACPMRGWWGDGNEVAAGRVKGINSNSICKAQPGDKVKSLFVTHTHTQTDR